MLLIPLAIACVAAFVAGARVAGGSAERDAVERFAAAWADGDYRAMYDELNATSQDEYPRQRFESAYTDAATTATATAVSIGEITGPDGRDGGDVVTVPATVQTSAFGEVSGDVAVPVADEGIAWQPNLVFPGLAEGDKLVAATKLAKRAPILAADGSVLASGPASARATNGAGGIVTGETGEPGRKLAEQAAALGYPEGVEMGTSGLELAFDPTLAGTPGESCSRSATAARRCSPNACRARASRCGRRSTRSFRTRPRRRSAPLTVAPPCSTPAAATSSPSPASRSRPRSRPARRSR